MSRKKGNGEGSISKYEKNGITYYRGFLTVGRNEEGKLIRKSFNSRKKQDVVNAMTNYKSKMLNSELSSNDKITLAEWYHTYIFEFRKNDLKPSTFERYYSIYKKYVLDSPIGNIKLVDLRTMDIQQYYNRLLELDKKTPSVVSTINRYLNTVLLEAVKQEIIKKAYSKLVKIPKVEYNSDYSVLSLEEQRQFIKAIQEHKFKCLFLMALGTGLREGELLALKWIDIDFVENTVSVSKTIKRVPIIEKDGSRKYKIVEQEPKTKSSIRIVPLPNNIVSELEKYKSKQNIEKLKNRDIYNDMNYVFSDEFGNPLESKRPNRNFQSVLKSIGIKPIKFHSLRHTYATRLFEQDVPIKTVQKLMGHKDSSTTLDIYTHVMPSEKIKAVDKINNLLSM
ncbi:site-specific integrase [Clostridium sardiniense]|uniref:Site-specific integrase n=1 Tax=Clostridium sardiniense TaxID=29369 RepID=A0ABS7L1K4_CLOSR|nr:site-specific integrase [Clostridium sardiniense]MBY0756950.1 site-specific integrase [Clostridium sardiniense]MBY0756974.1 site-specific integrase [Clostridium sardiniense]MDQ0460371.1 integrase [Clostridium sardiniense]